ncbi:flagellar FlbD family protein [Frigoribacterium sp. VKM Ac-2836]|uniref:flagellar FlbD family protein n=1 Tax=Frigoribacterium sp. VKM Ac-2836 TaxID=2739014 RepID=UPI0020B7119A|nr:flagellar FlbD family protein [Frigoribacterium sp. VKM Ac-2836]
MIVVTRLNDSRFAVNPDLIERIHETPDTVLIMVDGAKYVVTEPMAEVIEMIARYRARIVSLAYDEPSVTAPAGQALGNRTSTGPQLGIVRGSSGSGGAGRVTEFRPAVQAPAVHAPAPHAPAASAPTDATQGR